MFAHPAGKGKTLANGIRSGRLNVRSIGLVNEATGHHIGLSHAESDIAIHPPCGPAH
jgi:hypothetical protein